MTTGMIRKKNLLIALAHLSDKDYQHRAWFGLGPEVSSPTEVYNELFDDCGILDIINDSSSSLSYDTIFALRKLAEFLETIEVDDSEAAKLVDSSEWATARKLARDAGDLVAKDLKPN